MSRLMRTAVRESDPRRWSHPGLRFDRGLEALPDEAARRGEAIGDHLTGVCALDPPPIYREAYARWERLSDDETRCARWFGRVEGRLFVGLGMPHVLECQITRNRIYGMPLIPGSALKGAAWWGARRLGLDPAVCAVLFGRPGEGPADGGESGYLIFHDAWWVPDSAPTPFVPEIVTVHHPDYYAGHAQRPTPFDAPNPNHQIAARGTFLFVVEGASCWAALGLAALREALASDGIGAKTAAGYGFFVEEDAQARTRAEAARRRAIEARRHAAARRQAEIERRRREEEEQQHLKTLSAEGRHLYALSKTLDEAERKKAEGLLLEQDKEAINREIKRLLKEAPHWSEADRCQAADWIERAYDLVGWRTKPGGKGKKEEQKKRDRIEQLRAGGNPN